jgi:NAD+ synthase (glutamine-hydrolysing)
MKHSVLSLCRVAVISHDVKLANIPANVESHTIAISQAIQNGAQFIVFPELSLTGYTCSDLFYQDYLLQSAEKALCDLAECIPSGIIVIVGTPIQFEGKLYNCAAVLEGGNVHALVPKTIIPNHHEFYEARWFVSGDELPVGSVISLQGNSGKVMECPMQSRIIFRSGKLSFGIELCEDLWSMIPPSSLLARQGALLIANLSASNALVGKEEYRRSLVVMQSASTISAYCYASAGPSESTMDTVFSGHCMIAENGVMLAEDVSLSFNTKIIYSDIDLDALLYERRTLSRTQAGIADIFDTYELPPLHEVEFKELKRNIDPMPFVPSNPQTASKRCQEILTIQAMGLAGRLRRTGMKSMIIGLSGGLDSTLALIVCLETCSILNLDPSNIIAITMPGPGTTDLTFENTKLLALECGITFREIPIHEAVSLHLKDIGHSEDDHSVIYENAQARERTQILMDCAHQYAGLVIGTGDMSELALGWCTYNGDHMSMYGVNAGVPKTLVKSLVGYYASISKEPLQRILNSILQTPVSPELLPPKEGAITQRTEDILGPYVLHDFFLYHMMRHGSGPRKILIYAHHVWKHEFTIDEIALHLRTFYTRFFSQQFKRSAMPDSVKVGSIALSPRADWRMPSDAYANIWIAEIDSFLQEL